jgi:hypothetical protein
MHLEHGLGGGDGDDDVGGDVELKRCVGYVDMEAKPLRVVDITVVYVLQSLPSPVSVFEYAVAHACMSHDAQAEEDCRGASKVSWRTDGVV